MIISCKKCGMEFNVNKKSDVPASTNEEHLKHVGHSLEL